VRSGYLTVAGGTALRFAATADWPAPLPAKAADGEGSGRTGGVSSSNAGAAPGVDPAIAAAVAPGSVPVRAATITVESHSRSSGGSPAIGGRLPLVLTAEMVLESIDALPKGEGPEAPRFRPAVPAEGATREPGHAASTP
jgi:hypothetical protein